jgi:ElaB/YqjD/DUF883 family membrane-anchored ribosome-binding protein
MSDESGLRSGAAPALAAHSKDASTPGPTSASSSSGKSLPRTATVGEHAAEAIDAILTQGARAATPASDYVRAQPLAAVVAVGALCFALGLLFGRR